ncbi:MAG: hypothetical protein LBE98_00590 [Puniceicoccales bacterium]|jgi:hypothetical protein|nr:hypothetical protein [Puniceicoccales bacterium]
MPLTSSYYHHIEEAIELTGAKESGLVDLLHNIQLTDECASLHTTATKIQYKILEERQCLSGRIKFYFPKMFWQWRLRKNSGIGALLKEFKQGLEDIYRRSTDQTVQREIKNFFEEIGEDIGDPVQPERGEEGSVEHDFVFLNSSTRDQDSIDYVKSLLHGRTVSPRASVDPSIDQVFTKLNISRVDGIQNLTQEYLRQCVDENKPIVVTEGENALLIRKNEEGTLEVTKFTTQPKTLETHGGIQMDSGDYVNAFQLFDLKHKFDSNDSESSFKSIKTDLQKICDGQGKPKEVPQGKMSLIKSMGEEKKTTLEFELLQVLQYATKGNPSQEALVAKFEIDGYAAHLENIKVKMAEEDRSIQEVHTVTLNDLSRDVQQRILFLQASGKISTEEASQRLLRVNQTLTSLAQGPSSSSAVASPPCMDARSQSLEEANTTYTQDSALQTSQGHNIRVCDDMPTFLQQASMGQNSTSPISARLTMGFASAQRFEKLVSNHDGTLDALKGKDKSETLDNIGNFFRMAVAYTEYNKRNGIAVPTDKREIYDSLIRLGAAIYKKYGQECGIEGTRGLTTMAP